MPAASTARTKSSGNSRPLSHCSLRIRKGKRPLELDQERQAGALMKPWVEAQDPKASAVVQGRVPERPASRNFHKLNVHLDAFAGLRLLEELHLPGDPLSRPPKTRDAEIAKNALDRAHGNADVVNAAKPELGPGGAVGEFPARLADQLDDPRGHAAATTTGITRDEPLEAPLAPPHAPAPNRPHADPESACGRCRPVEPCEVEHYQSLSYSPPVLHPHLHIAQSNHRSPPLRQLGCPSKQRRSISGRYFRGTLTARPPWRHRTRQRRIVLTLTPHRRAAAVGHGGRAL